MNNAQNHTSKFKISYYNCDGKRCTKTITTRTFVEHHEMRTLAAPICQCDYHDIICWEIKK